VFGFEEWKRKTEQKQLLSLVSENEKESEYEICQKKRTT
jgi:hypothetical protein